MKKQIKTVILALLMFLVAGAQAYAVKDFNIKNNSQSFLYVNGTSGNVGIGSAFPGQNLDINGTARMTGFILSNNGEGPGYIMVGNSVGVGTWMPASTLPGAGSGSSGWTVTGNNVYETYGGNVGIGTNLLTTAALTVMNGNVGIGTWLPANSLDVVGGNVNIGTAFGVSSGGGNILTMRNDTSSIYAGYQTGNITSAGLDNVALGDQTLISITPGNNNVAVGYQALTFNSGNYNTVVGAQTLSNNSGAGNSALGYVALNSNTSGIYNSAVGYAALNDNSSGGYNAALGYGAGWVISDGATGNQTAGYSTYLGSSTKPLAIGDTNETIIGYNAIGNGSNSVTLGNALVTKTILQGNVGISSLAPGQTLDVVGTVRTVNFTMSGQAPVPGYVLTASDSSGDVTWLPTAGGASGWTVTGNNVYETNGGNVGIGTTLLTTAALTVMNGNVGIGTWVPSALFNVNGNSILGGLSGSASIISNGTYSMAGGAAINGGNSASITSSGIGSVALGYSRGTLVGNGSITANNSGSIALGLATGSTLLSSSTGSVAIGWAANGGTLESLGGGTIAMGLASTGTMQATGNGSIAMGYSTGTMEVAGDGSIALGENVEATNNNSLSFGNNVINPIGNSLMVGFNTTPTLFVTGSNVGINTTLSANSLDVASNVSIGTAYAGYKSAPPNGMLVQGNVGIGSTVPGQTLDVAGTVRAIGLTMSGQGPISGYVLTASDSSGDVTWLPTAGGASGWTVTGNNVYETNGGNVGIGTNLLTTAALTVMNGNVGIGTWVPGNALDVVAGNIGISSAYNISASGVVILSLHKDFSSIYLGFDAGGPTAGNLNNVAVGVATLALVGTGSNNTALGGDALNIATNSGNTAVGENALGALTSGSNDTALGYLAGLYLPGLSTFNQTSSNSIYIGYRSKPVADGDTNETVIGYDTQGIGSNTIELGNSSVITTQIQGNVGLGTTMPSGRLIVMNGNVGIGSLTPGQVLDVTGTVRTIGFTMSGSSPISGYVLTASDSAGDATWTSAGGISGWTVSGNNVYETNGGNVGIGTDLLTTAALTVMNGNVGIGTWVPGQALDIEGGGYVGIGTVIPAGSDDFIYINNPTSAANFRIQSGSSGNPVRVSLIGDLSGEGVGLNQHNSGFSNSDLFNVPSSASLYSGTGNSGGLSIITQAAAPIIFATGGTAFSNERMIIDGNGNVGIGTFNPFDGGFIVTNGNVGIGSLAPGQALDVNGTARMTGFTLTGEGAGNGYVMVGNNLGVGTWMAASTLPIASGSGSSGWTVSGNNVYETAGGNVGIGTNLLTTAALTVMNGNVGIGTWVPQAVSFNVVGGNVGIGTNLNNHAMLEVTGNGTKELFRASPNGQNDTQPFVVESTGNVGVGTTNPSFLFNVASTNSIITQLILVSSTYGVGGGEYGALQLLTNGSDAELSIGNSGNGKTGTIYPGSGNTAIRSDGTDMTLYTVNPGYIGFGYNIGGTPTESMRVYINGSGTANIGMGTTAPSATISVVGNVGIGTIGNGDKFLTTSPPNGGMIVEGNVGIGSLTPGKTLDVQGTVRAIGLTMSGSSPISGYVLTASDSAGDATWSPGGSVGGWTVTGSNVYQTYNGNVGIGTNLLTTAALTVMNGNVGIGTWIPNGVLDMEYSVNGPNSIFIGNTNSGTGAYAELDVTNAYQTPGAGGDGMRVLAEGTGWTTNGGYVQNAGVLEAGSELTNGMTIMSRVGNIRFVAGNFFNQVMVITNGNSVGIGTAVPTGALEIEGGNVGIGTAFTRSSALTVMNGNVGIGTWVPGATLDVNGNVRTFGNIGNTTLNTTGGNVGIGSTAPGMLLDAAGNIRGQQMIDTGVTANSLVYANGSQQLAAVTIGSGLTLTGSTLAASGSGAISGWTVSGNNVYETYNGNVGIGTNLLTTAALTVMNGNVGIGTWVPASPLQLVGTGSDFYPYVIAQSTGSGAGILVKMPNNCSRGGYTLNNGAVNWDIGTGFLGCASDLDIGQDEYTTPMLVIQSGSGNIGIGTNTPAGGLTVMNGNVGIGTWVPSGPLTVTSGGNTTTISGNIINSSTTLDLGTIGQVDIAAGYGSFLLAANIGTFFQEDGNGMQWDLAGMTINTGNTFINSIGDGLEVAQGVSIGTAYAGIDKAPSNGLIVQGNVGIGTWVPGQALDVNGNVRATSFISTSDARLKTNIQTIDGLKNILRMRGVRFNWKSNGQPEVGLIAQEVEKVLPEVVVTDSATGMKGLKYQSLVSPLIESTKELYGMYQKLDQEQDENSRAFAAIEADVALQKSEILRLEAENKEKDQQLQKLKDWLAQIKSKLSISP